MIETQLKELIKSLNITNELLTTLVTKHAVGGQEDAPAPHASGVPYDPAAAEPMTATEVLSRQSPPPQAAPEVATPTQQPVAETVAPVAAAPSTPAVDAQPAAGSPSKQAIGLQEKAMQAKNALNNPMFIMNVLSRYRKTAFDQLTPEEATETAAYIDACLAAGEVR